MRQQSIFFNAIFGITPIVYSVLFFPIHLMIFMASSEDPRYANGYIPLFAMTWIINIPDYPLEACIGI
jgi:hypothetical protein